MTAWCKMPQRLRSAVGTLGLVGLSACQARPIPMIALEGTTIVLPVPPIAYGSEVGRNPLLPPSVQRHDYQRGELVVALCDPTTGAVVRRLVTRYVTSVVPHPASPAALRGSMEFYSYGSNWHLVGQGIAVLEIPEGILAPMETERLFTLSVRIKPYGGEPSTEVLAADQPGTIRIHRFHDSGQASPGYTKWDTIFHGPFELSISQDLVDLIPYPTVPVRLASEAQIALYPAAGEVVVNYDSPKVEIKGAYESKHPGRWSLVRMRDEPANSRVRLFFVDPRRCTTALRIAYELRPNGGSPPTPIVPTSVFSVDAAMSHTFDLSGVVQPENSFVIGEPSTDVVCGES